MALITWEETSVTVGVGETATVGFQYGRELDYLRPITTTDSSVATISTSGNPSSFYGMATITGIAPGTVTSVPDTRDTQNTPLTITVTAPADDQNFLNERGLAHFWGNIDSTKQNKLTAGSNITINNDTISATQPTVNNATLTIKQNSTTLGTFTANASTGTTVTISTPTRTTIYSNSSGTNANFSTTSAMSNYDDVEITFRDGNSNYATRTVPGSAGSFVLDISHPGGSSTVYWYISRFIVGGTNITVGANNMRKALQATGLTTTASQDIYVTKMVGIKY